MAAKKAAAKKAAPKKAAPAAPTSTVEYGRNRKKAVATTESAKGFITHRSMKDAAKKA